MGPTGAGETRLPPHIRRKGVAVCESVLRLARLCTDVGDGDILGFVIYLGVVAGSLSGLARNPEIARRYGGDEPMPPELMVVVSRRAIAESLGLPRETVRRKILKLIADGHIEERDGGVVPAGPVLERRNNLQFVQAAIREINRVHAELARIDAQAARAG